MSERQWPDWSPWVVRALESTGTWYFVGVLSHTHMEEWQEFATAVNASRRRPDGIFLEIRLPSPSLVSHLCLVHCQHPFLLWPHYP